MQVKKTALHHAIFGRTSSYGDSGYDVQVKLTNLRLVVGGDYSTQSKLFVNGLPIPTSKKRGRVIEAAFALSDLKEARRPFIGNLRLDFRPHGGLLAAFPKSKNLRIVLTMNRTERKSFLAALRQLAPTPVGPDDAGFISVEEAE